MTNREIGDTLCNATLEMLDRCGGNASEVMRKTRGVTCYAQKLMINGNSVSIYAANAMLEAAGYEIEIKKKEGAT